MEQELSNNSDAFSYDGDNSGDFHTTNLTFHNTSNQSIGKYGRLRKRYLEEHQPTLYEQMLKSNRLMQHLAEAEQAACNRDTPLATAMAKQEDIPEMQTMPSW